MDEQDGVAEVKRAIFLLFLLSCSSGSQVVFDSGAVFNVEVADSLDERAKGLMFREYLAEGHGMLFVFDDNAPQSFWMKNTLMSLDMVFIDSNLTVVEVKANVPPCEADPCPSYRSLPAMYVLEMNAGVSHAEGISVGSQVVLR